MRGPHLESARRDEPCFIQAVPRNKKHANALSQRRAFQNGTAPRVFLTVATLASQHTATILDLSPSQPFRTTEAGNRWDKAFSTQVFQARFFQARSSQPKSSRASGIVQH
jgi:hypothetical protein